MMLENFIVFEGLDGAGTTTQAHLLCKKLVRGFFTCEPTDSVIGKLIRRILRQEEKLDLCTLPYLFAADRADHVVRMKDLIAQEHQIICDRYLFSSLAYQSLDHDLMRIYDINKEFPLPHIVFFIDTPVDIAMKRVGARDNLEIFEKTPVQKKVYEHYKYIFNTLYKNKLELYILDGTKSIEEIHHEIVFLLEKTILKKFIINS